MRRARTDRLVPDRAGPPRRPPRADRPRPRGWTCFVSSHGAGVPPRKAVAPPPRAECDRPVREPAAGRASSLVGRGYTLAARGRCAGCREPLCRAWTDRARLPAMGVRRFRPKARVAFFLAAQGRCTRCGEPLRPGWHGDHVVPVSGGGATE